MGDFIDLPKDWRDKLALAVSYRMHYRNPRLDRVEAETQVRNFMKYGTSDSHGREVMEASFEMFGDLLKAFAPTVRAVMSAINEEVEREIRNGREIEAGLR